MICAMTEKGYPRLVVSDNGTEPKSNAILTWQQDRKVEWPCIAPGELLNEDNTGSRSA